MNPADRLRLRQILATFDETGLVALANKGLVRRAQKDCEAGGLSSEETDLEVIVRGPDWTVTMPATGPIDARDDTRATGVTRQILTATMFLRDQWCTVEPSATAAAAIASPSAWMAPAQNDDGSTEARPPSVEVLPTADGLVPPVEPPTDDRRANPHLEPAIKALEQLTIDDLIKWAGKTIVADSLAIVRLQPTLEVERAFGLIVRFPQHETEVRILPKPWGRGVGSLLDQFLTNAPKAFRRQWVVAAVVALRQSLGRPDLSLDDVSMKEAVENLQGRSQVLTTSAKVLDGLMRTGLAHPSQRMVQRLFTLSVSATGCHLPRLSRSLRAIADEVELILNRDAKGNADRLFDQLCVTQALVTALLVAGTQPPIDLVGRHRSEYEETGDLQLSGAGAFPWRTASGFEGVTALFWDERGERFWTWTESRPEDGLGRFNTEDVYNATAPWKNGPALSDLCRRSFTLKNAKANPQGRLSASQQCTVELSSPNEWPTQNFGVCDFKRWSTLAEYARRIHPIGLRIPDPLQRIVVIRPREWGPRLFDETKQRLVWTVVDEDGLPLQVIVGWAEVNEQTIAFLESLKIDRDRVTGLISRLERRATGLVVEPLVVLSDGTAAGDRLLNPAFDRKRIELRQASLLDQLREKFGRGKLHTVTSVDDDRMLALDEDPFPPGIERSLADLEGRLQRLAETGMHQLDDPHRRQLTELVQRLDRSGLSQLAEGVRQLCQTADPAALLRCRYLCRLHREAAVLA